MFCIKKFKIAEIYKDIEREKERKRISSISSLLLLLFLLFSAF
tara:strand:- start:507 stop:635 length:129 start_codon:yes stop_codon:yes gene_type:complete